MLWQSPIFENAFGLLPSANPSWYISRARGLSEGMIGHSRQSSGFKRRSGVEVTVGAGVGVMVGGTGVSVIVAVGSGVVVGGMGVGSILTLQPAITKAAIASKEKTFNVVVVFIVSANKVEFYNNLLEISI